MDEKSARRTRIDPHLVADDAGKGVGRKMCAFCKRRHGVAVQVGAVDAVLLELGLVLDGGDAASASRNVDVELVGLVEGEEFLPRLLGDLAPG